MVLVKFGYLSGRYWEVAAHSANYMCLKYNRPTKPQNFIFTWLDEKQTGLFGM